MNKQFTPSEILALRYQAEPKEVEPLEAKQACQTGTPVKPKYAAFWHNWESFRKLSIQSLFANIWVVQPHLWEPKECHETLTPPEGLEFDGTFEPRPAGGKTLWMSCDGSVAFSGRKTDILEVSDIALAPTIDLWRMLDSCSEPRLGLRLQQRPPAVSPVIPVSLAPEERFIGMCLIFQCTERETGKNVNVTVCARDMDDALIALRDSGYKWGDDGAWMQVSMSADGRSARASRKARVVSSSVTFAPGSFLG